MRFRAAVIGGALTAVTVAVVVVVSLISVFGHVSAGGAPSPTPPLLAQGPGAASLPTDLAAATPVHPLPSSDGSAGHPGATSTPFPDATPVPTDGSGIPLPTPSPTPTPTPTPPGGPTSPEPEQLTGYEWPLRNARVSSFFEDRTDGFLVVDGQRIHEGLDLATFCGDQIHAAHAGTVIAVGRRFDPVMGFDGSLNAFYERIKRKHSMYQLPIVVVVDDGNGYRSAYVHLGLASVKVGKVVKAGDLLGYEGRTGRATGCHLHYELFRMDGPWMAVAPDLVKRDHYPTAERERIDPFRVLTMKQPGHPHFMSGVDPPAISPGLGRPTVGKH
jgi:murein DD-endopeptidase MepM/ murein hydrolase activator NlpD